MKTKLMELEEDKNFHIKSAEQIIKKVGDNKMTDEQRRSLKEHKEKAEELDKEISEYREIESEKVWLATQTSTDRKPELRHYQQLDNEPKNPIRFTEPKEENLRELAACQGYKLKHFDNDETGYRQAYATFHWHKAISSNCHNVDSVRWCEKNGVEIRAMSEGTNSAGGYAVPSLVAAAIVNYLYKWGFARQNCTILPMGESVVSLPILATGNIATYKTEGTAVDSLDPVLGVCKLTAAKMGGYTLISEELDQDAVFPIADMVVEQLGQAILQREDKSVLLGDGTSTYGNNTGIIPTLQDGAHGTNLVITSGHNTFANMDITDLNTMIATLPAQFHATAKWYCSRYAWAALFNRLATAANGNNVLTYQENIGFRFAGYPMVFTDVLPKSASAQNDTIMVLFGDLNAAIGVGTRRDITVVRSTEFKVMEGQIAYKATERFACTPKYIGWNGTTATGPQYVGALVGFQGHA